jgi:RNA 3'-terminal phosphate cyclase
MTNGLELGSEQLETDPEDRRDVVEGLVQRGEIEVVTTASGEILYILQSLDE